MKTEGQIRIRKDRVIVTVVDNGCDRHSGSLGPVRQVPSETWTIDVSRYYSLCLRQMNVDLLGTYTLSRVIFTTLTYVSSYVTTTARTSDTRAAVTCSLRSNGPWNFVSLSVDILSVYRV